MVIALSRKSFGALCVMGLLTGAAAPALALTTEHGTICKPYATTSPSSLGSYLDGVQNVSGSTIYVVCPVVRTIAAPAGGFTVWVDGSANNGTVYCYLYSYNYNRQLLGSTSFNATGTFDRTLTLPQDQVTTYSSQVVFCSLPPGGAVFDVEPVQ